MNIKLFFACGTALLLMPLFSHPAQAKEENPSELHRDHAEIVSDLLTPHTTQFTAHETSSPPRIILRCDQLTRYGHEDIYTSEDFFESINEHSTNWETHSHYEGYEGHHGGHHETHHETQRRSTIRDILRSHPGNRTSSHALTIEIEGQCNDIQVQVESPSTISHPPQPLPYPNSSQPPSIEQYLEWYEDQMMEENIPWIIRPGSGWHWLLRDH